MRLRKNDVHVVTFAAIHPVYIKLGLLAVKHVIHRNPFTHLGYHQVTHLLQERAFSGFFLFVTVVQYFFGKWYGSFFLMCVLRLYLYLQDTWSWLRSRQ